MRWVVLVCVLAGSAAAQKTNENIAEADKLFFEARALLEKEQYAEACAMFELSFRKNPRAVGTILNLGLCSETAGKVATAVRYFAEARDRARDQSMAQYQEAAERKVALLSPRVPHLRITLAERLPDLRVLVDDVVLALDQLADVTVDPGKRTIVVTARGRLPYETTIEIAEAKHETVAIPRLEGQKTVIVDPSRRKLWGKIAVGAGAGLLVTGGALGWWSRRSYWAQFPSGARDGEVVMDAAHDCWIDAGGLRQCNAIGTSQLTSARRIGHAGTAIAIMGGAAVITGVVLWLTAPERDDAGALPVSVTVRADGASAAIAGRF